MGPCFSVARFVSDLVALSFRYSLLRLGGRSSRGGGSGGGVSPFTVGQSRWLAGDPVGVCGLCGGFGLLARW